MIVATLTCVAAGPLGFGTLRFLSSSEVLSAPMLKSVAVPLSGNTENKKSVSNLSSKSYRVALNELSLCSSLIHEIR